VKDEVQPRSREPDPNRPTKEAGSLEAHKCDVPMVGETTQQPESRDFTGELGIWDGKSRAAG
jgi:hypothetical protein